MLGGLGIVAALVRWEEIAERLFPKCKLRALRGPGESYSEIILKLAGIEAAKPGRKRGSRTSISFDFP